MVTGDTFYVSNIIFNDREQVLLYSSTTGNLIVSVHGGQDIKDNTDIRFLCDTPVTDIPTKIRCLFNHLDEHDCYILSIHDDLIYYIKPATPFVQK